MFFRGRLSVPHNNPSTDNGQVIKADFPKNIGNKENFMASKLKNNK